MGAPIVTPQGDPVAALCLIGPTRDFPGNRIERLALQLSSTAARIVDAQRALLEAWQTGVSDSEI